MVKDFYSVYKFYVYFNEYWIVVISDEDGWVYFVCCQGFFDLDFYVYLLFEMVLDSDLLFDEDLMLDNEMLCCCEVDRLCYFGMDVLCFFEIQILCFIDFFNFDLEVCLMVELKEEDVKNVVVFLDSNIDIGFLLLEIL